jgi:hypothetical protein
MEQQNRGVRGYGDPDFIGELETTATLKLLLGEQDLNVTEELTLVCCGKTGEERNIALDNPLPLGEQRERTQASATPSTQNHDFSWVAMFGAI